MSYYIFWAKRALKVKDARVLDCAYHTYFLCFPSTFAEFNCEKKKVGKKKAGKKISWRKKQRKTELKHLVTTTLNNICLIY